MLLGCIEIREIAGMGRGIYTTDPIEMGTVVEIAPVLILPDTDKALVDQTSLFDYYFLWGDDQLQYAIALGYASLYNHSYSPNCVYEAQYEDKVLHILALRDIAAGEQLTFNYNCDPTETKEVWFDVRS
jgi:uncharacterized protein